MTPIPEIKVAVFAAVHMLKDSCSIEIPDLGLVQYGNDYADAYTLATMRIDAIHEYDTARGLAYEVKATFEDVQKLCDTRRGDFPTCITVS